MSDATGPDLSGTTDASVGPDKYDDMLRLAEMFDTTGEDLRARARLGAEVLADEDVADSEPLSRQTFAVMADDVRAATTGKNGILNRSLELDADALVVRATVLTYRWIDELQNAAYRTLGSIAGRALGYLAPEVALGGAIVSAGLIETDAMDRDDVASYLNELAENNPDLMDHLTAGGGGLVESLQLRSLLTAGALALESGPLAAVGGMRAAGIPPFPIDTSAAVRDVAGQFVQASIEADASGSAGGSAAGELPDGLSGLIENLSATSSGVGVHKVGDGRYIAYLPGPDGGSNARLRLVGGDLSSYSRRVSDTLKKTLTESGSRVMLVGGGPGGLVAAELAAGPAPVGYVIEQVVTAGSPSAQAPRIPQSIRVLSLEDRADPVALLGSLMNAESTNRLTVVFEGGRTDDSDPYVVGARAADSANHPELRAELDRLRELGYLAAAR